MLGVFWQCLPLLAPQSSEVAADAAVPACSVDASPGHIEAWEFNMHRSQWFYWWLRIPTPHGKDMERIIWYNLYITIIWKDYHWADGACWASDKPTLESAFISVSCANGCTQDERMVKSSSCSHMLAPISHPASVETCSVAACRFQWIVWREHIHAAMVVFASTIRVYCTYIYIVPFNILQPMQKKKCMFRASNVFQCIVNIPMYPSCRWLCFPEEVLPQVSAKAW